MAPAFMTGPHFLYIRRSFREVFRLGRAVNIVGKVNFSDGIAPGMNRP
jgi:hypothetical protein